MTNVSLIMTKTLNQSQKEVLEKFKQFQQAMIDKDSDKLNEIISDNYTLTHMSGKTQTKEEFINEIRDGVLNYYASTIHEPEIIVNGDKSRIVADVDLDAKVYGMKGVWTVKTDLKMIKTDSDWIISDWKT